MSTLLHLVYIHGFQGDHTTFQAFPKDLQEYLDAHLPSRNLDLKIQTSLYPTYKSVKPLSHATKNFLEWLSTQPPGPVILMGHSMGGLLAADAATHPSNAPDYPGGKPKRIVGVIAFDTPFLGMHPHVVISGIASLLPKDGEQPHKDRPTEESLNHHPNVHVVDRTVTDEWEDFKKKITAKAKRRSGSPHLLPPTDIASIISRPPSHTPRLDRALAYFGASTDHPFVRWMHKHADEPFTAGKRWIVERFQFGGAMFDPAGLKDRYVRLVHWQGGLWVNYWTQTPRKEPTADTPSSESPPRMSNDEALVVNGILPSPTSTASFQGSISTADSQESGKPHKPKRGRHFVVLPDGAGERLGGWDRWENVVIGGVESEVTAHMGLFIPGHNLDYPGFVASVGNKIFLWCDEIPGIHRR